MKIPLKKTKQAQTKKPKKKLKRQSKIKRAFTSENVMI
jgi:hypothetical protein